MSEEENVKSSFQPNEETTASQNNINENFAFLIKSILKNIS